MREINEIYYKNKYHNMREINKYTINEEIYIYAE